MLGAAAERVIISEPVRNLTASSCPVIAAIGRRAADPGVGTHAQRFTEATLDALMDRYRDSVRIPAEPGRTRKSEKLDVLDSR